MAAKALSAEAASIDWEAIQTQLWQERPAKHRTELSKAQDVWTSEQVKLMGHEEVAFHVLNLRKTQGKPSAVSGLVHGFVPTVFVPNPAYKPDLLQTETTSRLRSQPSLSRPSSPTVQLDASAAPSDTT